MFTIEDLKDFVTYARAWMPNAIIAGGAVRDLTCGAPIKDVDLFVGLENPTDYEGEESSFAMFCKHFARHIGAVPEFKPSDPEYGNLLDLCKLHPEPGWSLGIPHTLCHGVPFDIVAIPGNPMDDVPLYDFGLSQMAVTPAGRFFTDAAVTDLQQRTITYMRGTIPDAYAVIRSKKRLARLRAKYPHWLFRNCERLDMIPEGMDGFALAARPDLLAHGYPESFFGDAKR